VHQTLTCFDIEVDAPDGASAFALEQRFAHLAPTTVVRDGRWTVEIPAAESAEEIEAAVRWWLTQIGAPETSMRIAGRSVRVAAPRSTPSKRHQASNERFIG
jgi:hypothetical protein